MRSGYRSWSMERRRAPRESRGWTILFSMLLGFALAILLWTAVRDEVKRREESWRIPEAVPEAAPSSEA